MVFESNPGKVASGYSLSALSPSQTREIADLSPRPDLFSRLMKLLASAKCGSNKAFDDTRRSPDLLVANKETHAHSPVSLLLEDASKSTDTLRSSSESIPLRPANCRLDAHDPFERTMPKRVTRTPSSSRNRNKRERKAGRRKGRVNKPLLSEPVTNLTTIPEISSAFERNSYPLQLNFTSTESLLTEDALMDTDSSRARTAIALARAQLEHSRPASIHRKRERATNRLMMLPGELEEYQAMRVDLASYQQPAMSDFGSLVDHERAEATRRTVQQSRSMVITLMTANEAISQRSRKNSHTKTASISTIDLFGDCQTSFSGAYKSGNAPLCPPPSIPLPRVPSLALVTLPVVSTSPKHERVHRSQTAPRSSVYNGLPTEYDDAALRHVDNLIQDLIDSHLGHEASAKRLDAYANSDSRGIPADDNRVDKIVPQLNPAVTEPAPARKPTCETQVAIRRPLDGAPLTPAPTPPIGYLNPLKTIAGQRNGRGEIVSGASRGAQYCTQSATPNVSTPTHNGQRFHSYASPQRPTRRQSLVGPDPPRWLVEAKMRHSGRDMHACDQPLARPPGIAVSTSNSQSPFAHTPPPQHSPQKPAYSNYRYI